MTRNHPPSLAVLTFADREAFGLVIINQWRMAKNSQFQPGGLGCSRQGCNGRGRHFFLELGSGP